MGRQTLAVGLALLLLAAAGCSDDVPALEDGDPPAAQVAAGPTPAAPLPPVPDAAGDGALDGRADRAEEPRESGAEAPPNADQQPEELPDDGPSEPVEKPDERPPGDLESVDALLEAERRAEGQKARDAARDKLVAYVKEHRLPADVVRELLGRLVLAESTRSEDNRLLQALAWEKSSAIREVLERVAEQAPWQLRVSAVGRLAGYPEFDYLAFARRRLATDQDYFVRHELVKGIAWLRKRRPEAAPILRELIASWPQKDWSLITTGVRALRFSDPADRLLLESLADHPTQAVRHEVLAKWIKEDGGDAKLLHLLEQRLSPSAPAKVRTITASTLMQTRSKSFDLSPTLVDLLRRFVAEQPGKQREAWQRVLERRLR